MLHQTHVHFEPNQLEDMASKKLPAALVTGLLSLLRLFLELCGTFRLGPPPGGALDCPYDVSTRELLTMEAARWATLGFIAPICHKWGHV